MKAQLNLQGDHVYVYFDTSTLPSMPLRTQEDIYIQSFDITGPPVGLHTSCLQIDRSNIYMPCVILPPDHVREDPETGAQVHVPIISRGRVSCCIRVWDFTP